MSLTCGTCSRPHHTRNESIEVTGKRKVTPLRNTEIAASLRRLAIVRTRVNVFIVMESPNDSTHRWRPLCDSRTARRRRGAAIRCSAVFGLRAATPSRSSRRLGRNHNKAKAAVSLPEDETKWYDRGRKPQHPADHSPDGSHQLRRKGKQPRNRLKKGSNTEGQYQHDYRREEPAPNVRPPHPDGDSPSCLKLHRLRGCAVTSAELSLYDHGSYNGE